MNASAAITSRAVTEFGTEARHAGTDCHVVPLVPDKLYALQCIVPLDGRVAAFPHAATGYAPINCYLLKQGDHAMMLDTGFTAHRDSILRAMEQVLGRDATVTLFPLRMNEFMSLCNAMAIADRFQVDGCISVLRDAAFWVDLESIDPADVRSANTRLKTILISGNETLQLGHDNKRSIQLYQSPVRLIATRWVHDPETQTLFTSDMFSGLHGATPDEDWMVDDPADDPTTVEDMTRFLLGTRYWWLEGATTDELRRGLGKIFDACDVTTLAPGYGKIIRGRALVERHVAMLDETLRRLDRQYMPPRYIDRDEVR